MSDTVIIDASGIPCPMPLIKLKKALSEYPGHVIELHASDKGSLRDIPAYCDLKGLSCESQESDRAYVFHIKGAE